MFLNSCHSFGLVKILLFYYFYMYLEKKHRDFFFTVLKVTVARGYL